MPDVDSLTGDIKHWQATPFSLGRKIHLESPHFPRNPASSLNHDVFYATADARYDDSRSRDADELSGIAAVDEAVHKHEEVAKKTSIPLRWMEPRSTVSTPVLVFTSLLFSLTAFLILGIFMYEFSRGRASTTVTQFAPPSTFIHGCFHNHLLIISSGHEKHRLREDP